MEKLIWETAEEIDMKLAGRIRGIRKRRSISQKKLSEMSGVSYGSIKRFETTGQISLLSLTKLAFALNEVDEIRNLFIPFGSEHFLLRGLSPVQRVFRETTDGIIDRVRENR